MKSPGPDRPTASRRPTFRRPPSALRPRTVAIAAVVLLVVHCSAVSTSSADDGGNRTPYAAAADDDDTVVIEGYPFSEDNTADTRTTRTKRQNSWTTVSGPCLTSRGTLGKCTSFRSCYPYIKLPDFQFWDPWVIGMYDTCTFTSADHKQMFGVCCDHPSVVGTDESHKEEGIRPPPPPTMVVPPNWPPPLPTHPPDHTIPPIPTHPPSPSPPQPPTSPPLKPPMKPPTIPPWPPQVPANTSPPYKPPTTTTTTTTTPSYKPPTTTTTPSSVDSEDGVHDYQCGLKNGPQDQERIVGGQNADPGEWPWIVAIFNAGRHFCGGSLIDDTHVLTAAHCVAHMSSWDVARLTANLGDYNIKSKSDVKHLERKIKRVVRHKGFDQRTLYNDIALLTLDKPVKFTKQVHPICLPTSRSMYAGQTATVIGWGSLRESGPQPAVLQKVNVPVWTNQECKFKYGSAAPGGIVDHFLCAGKAARDSCSGDSGGPLMLNDGKWTQVGIVSWGIGCGKGQYPGVYTRVTSFMNWITKNLKT
ncbi:Serine proteases, trypsin family, serine active site,Peptidase S1, PA clan,Serine proteases, trypsin [Cinara cedri]|uniref:Phenoloxidase-activating factor 2 n=1 Tax=Cinara cedri TaxID=506608 RepID=A0A5E4NPP2_9HEMI|nr:Serine proteases, trypsin family, serine active site,Peptidase S1, PA clan,Serine proteases, trypsin [Cinara cedri]